MMSDEPFCTCTSKLPARTSFRVRRLYRHCHVYHSIKMLTLRDRHRLLYWDGWYLALHHNWDIGDPVNVLDLWISAVFCTPESQAPVMYHNVHVHHLVLELHQEYLNSLLDLLDHRHLSLHNGFVSSNCTWNFISLLDFLDGRHLSLRDH